MIYRIPPARSTGHALVPSAVAWYNNHMSEQPRHAARATRTEGRQTRARLLDAASELFRERGINGVAMSEIAAAADCFPSQVTYYFGDKEALFIESACRDVLAVRAAVEKAARRARTPAGAVRGMVAAALDSNALLGFVEAILLIRRRLDLGPLVHEAFEALHAEAERAAVDVMSSHGWETPAGSAIQSRAFWSAIIGVALESAAAGVEFDRQKAVLTVQAVLNFQRP